jgi:hypothetical protein
VEIYKVQVVIFGHIDEARSCSSFKTAVVHSHIMFNKVQAFQENWLWNIWSLWIHMDIYSNNKVKLNSWFEIDEKEYFWYILQGYTIKGQGRRVEWKLDGKPHRTDGPAYIGVNGTQEWYRDNKLHRTDGPAVIRADGTQEWYRDNKLHRTDGPAVIRADGTQEWWIDDKLYTEKQFNDYYKKINTLCFLES